MRTIYLIVAESGLLPDENQETRIVCAYATASKAHHHATSAQAREHELRNAWRMWKEQSDPTKWFDEWHEQHAHLLSQNTFDAHLSSLLGTTYLVLPCQFHEDKV